MEDNEVTIKDIERAIKILKETDNNIYPCFCYSIDKRTGFCFKHNMMFVSKEEMTEIRRLFREKV